MSHAASPQSSGPLSDHSPSPDPQIAMRVFLSLHGKLWKRSFKSNPSQFFMAGFIIFYSVIGVLGLGIWSMTAASEGSFYPLVLSMAAGSLIYWMLAVVWPSGEQQVDVAKMTTIPLSVRRLMPVLAVTSVLQVRGVVSVVNTLAMIVFGAIGVSMNGSAWAIALWIVAAALSVSITLLGGEAIAAMIANTGGRSWRDRMGLISTLLFLVAIFGLNVALSSTGTSEETLRTAARVLVWTPVGAAPGLTTSVLDGNYLAAGAQGLIAVVTVIVLWKLWSIAVLKSLRRVTESGTSARGASSGSVLVAGLPATTFAATASATLRYWRRDIRLSYSLFSMPLMAVLFLVFGSFSEDSAIEYFGLLLIGIATAMLTANSLGYDGPANWVHMAAGLKAGTLLWARTITALFVAAVLMTAYTVALGILGGFHGFWALVTVVSAAALLVNAGFATLMAVFNAYPTAVPGTNPMKDRSGFSAGAFILTFVALVVVWVPLSPGLVMMIKGLNEGHGFVSSVGQASALFWAGAVVSIVIGVAVLFIGHWLAIRRLARRWPEIFAKVNSFV